MTFETFEFLPRVLKMSLHCWKSRPSVEAELDLMPNFYNHWLFKWPFS